VPDNWRVMTESWEAYSTMYFGLSFPMMDEEVAKTVNPVVGDE